MKTPRVSVCVPTYNGARYLDACLKSILAQTFPDFEVLIVDDCSDDDTLAIAARWASLDSRIEVHQNPVNLGLVGNWNHSIGLARGEWIKFLFQDDLMDPECLAALLASAEGGGGFSACARELLFEGEFNADLRSFFEYHRLSVESIFESQQALSAEAFCAVKLEHLDINIVGEPSVTLIRKSLFKEVGLFDPAFVQLCDSEMWNRLGSVVGVQYVPRKLVTFRVHSSSVSSMNYSSAFRDVFDGIREGIKIRDSLEYEPFRRYLHGTGRSKEIETRLKTLIYTAFYIARDLRQKGIGLGKSGSELRQLVNQVLGYRRACVTFFLHRLRKSLAMWASA